jgi:hypothetical protein
MLLAVEGEDSWWWWISSFLYADFLTAEFCGLIFCGFGSACKK